jgi:demethylmenaquinone methyltransferase/2-methoxy-6-polyprenyl-1,4-benzoquinol methylase
MLAKQEVQAMYQSGAKYYDFTTLLYRLIGLRMNRYRSLAVKLLRLKRGGSIIELGCGTGLNFPLLVEQIGPEGRLVGVDLTPGMLERARERVERSGWKNVELVQSDIARYDIPHGVDGVLATGVFGYVAGYDRVIKAASEALVPGGRMVILDGQQPRNLPAWLFKVVLRLGRPFGFTPEYFNVRPRESVERYFQETSFEEMYGGLIYLSCGTAGTSIGQAADESRPG